MKRFFALAPAVLLLMSACAQSGSRPPAPASAPPAIVETVPPPAANLSEARAQRRAGQLREYERSLRHLGQSSDADSSRRARALLALFLFDEKRWDEAAPALENAALESWLLAPFLRLRLMETQSNRGNAAEAISVAAQIIATAPSSTAATAARLRLPALYAQVGDAGAADAAFAQLSGIAVDELNERDFLDVATVLANAQRSDLAARLRMRLLTEYPQGRHTEKVYADLVEQADAPVHALPLVESVELASSLARVNRYDQALDLLQRIALRFPEAAADEAYRRVRYRALFGSRNYAQLLAETENVPLDDPALILLRARAAWRADQPQLFLSGLEELEKKHPRTPQATEAKIQRAKYYVTDEVDYEKSIRDLTAAIDAGVLGAEAEHLWTLGWTYTLAGRYDDALRVYDRYIAAYPDGDYKTNSLFWSAKIFQRLGRTADRDARLRQIMLEYPYSYYAYRAREILGVPAIAPSEITGGAIFPDLDAQLAQVTSPRIEVVRELLSVDLTQDATREMKVLAAEYPDNSGVAFMLADVYAGAGEPFRANGVLQRRFRQFVRHGGAEVPRRFWEILFPLNYWESIQAEAERRELDPYLVASIIRQESGFEPATVSNAGAVGLMQIMPGEAPRIASLAGLEGITRERLFDPTANIAIGAAEYAQKLERMGGNHIHAIAAYNAGEVPVGRWIAQTPDGDPDLFVESIPYAETRLYVKSVTRNRHEYRRIYESSNAAPKH